MMGEAGYYFTNLVSTNLFDENCSRRTLLLILLHEAYCVHCFVILAICVVPQCPGLQELNGICCIVLELLHPWEKQVHVHALYKPCSS